MPDGPIEWVQTTKWTPANPGGGSAGFSVECPSTSELGHGKPTAVAQEVLAHRLARLIGVPVPETVLGVVNGKTIAISKSWGAKSLDVPTIMQASPGDAALTAALRAASGLLAFHAWLGTDDLKDQHLVVRGPTPGQYEVASIDFA